MAGRLTVQERAQIAAHYEVWRSIVEVQRWWRTIKGRHAQIDPKTIKNCHAKLMTTGSVSDTQRSGRPSKFRDPEVVQVVQEMFSRSPQKSKWMGRRGSHEWPVRSPDLTPCDFFLWGWLKEQVYSTKPKNLEELEGRIREVMSSIPQEFLVKSVDAVHGRLEKLVANDGAHIEF